MKVEITGIGDRLGEEGGVMKKWMKEKSEGGKMNHRAIYWDGEGWGRSRVRENYFVYVKFEMPGRHIGEMTSRYIKMWIWSSERKFSLPI